MEATSAFSNSNVVLSACILDTFCPEQYVRSAGSLCDNWLTPMDGQDCGDVGMYEISAEEKIPEADVSSSWSWMVTVKIGMEDECEAEASSYQMGYSAIGLVSLALGATFAARKRRGADERDDEKASRFLEMSDAGVV